MNNQFFIDMARKVGPIIKKDLGFSLDFTNFNQIHEDIVLMEGFDIDSLFNVTENTLLWANYLTSLYNNTKVLEEEKNFLELRVKGIEDILKDNIKKSQKVDEDTFKILKKYNIENTKELYNLQTIYNYEYKNLKLFNRLLEGKIKYFQAMHIRAKELLAKSMYSLHFGFNV